MKARFHIPGFAQAFSMNYMFVQMVSALPQYFYDDVEIASVYGVFPPAMWNGGRLKFGRCDKDFIKQVIRAFNGKGIPLRFTFTNPVIEEKHLRDEFCNMIMKMADNGMNEVIVMSPLLEDYIREKYPKYKITSSTCKRITSPEKLSEELERDYHIVVVDYDMNNRFDMLEKLPNKEKCEILVNACCNPGCKLRSEHYRSIGAEQIAFSEHIKKEPNKNFNFYDYKQYSEYFSPETEKCECMSRSLFEIKSLRTHITPEDIREKYMPMGFSQFKIEGRSLEMLNLIEHYMYYMAKPECRDEARYLLMCQLVRQGILKPAF